MTTTTTTTTAAGCAVTGVIGEGDARARTVAARLLALAGDADRRHCAPDAETRTPPSRTTVGPPWSSGTQVVQGERRHEPAE